MINKMLLIKQWYNAKLAIEFYGHDIFPLLLIIFGGMFISPFLNSKYFAANNAKKYLEQDKKGGKKNAW